MIVSGVVLDGVQCLIVSRWVERVLKHDPRLLDPDLAPILREINAHAHAERHRHVEAQWRAGLVPLKAAADHLGVPERTLQHRAATGAIPAVKDEHGHWLIELPPGVAETQPARRDERILST